MTRQSPLPLLFGVLILALTACSEPASSSTPTEHPTAVPTASPAEPLTPAPSPTPSPTPAELRGAPTASVVDRLLVQDGLDLPWDAAWTPGGTMLVTMRDEARILRYEGGDSDYLIGPGASWLRHNVDKTGEGGLLGIALSPTNPNVTYLYLTGPDGNMVVRALRFGQMLEEPTVILSGIPKRSTHNGGRIRFGPDGYLYIATGDAQDRPASQNLDSLAGKILRIVADGTDKDGSPAPGNPFGTLIWTYGHRNVQGLGWAPDGRMYASELGQNTQDELNLIEPGRNYGWPVKEGMVGAPRGTAPGQTVDGYTFPVAVWATSEASPSGLVVTDEAVYMGALRGQRVWRLPLTPEGLGVPHVLLDDLGRIRLVDQGPNGHLYVLTSNTPGGDQPTGVDVIVRIVVSEDD